MDRKPMTVVATFPGRRAAEQAADALRRGGFEHPWLGAVAEPDAGSERVQAINVAERAARWLRAAGDETLEDALRKRGVAGADAKRLCETVPPHSCILVARGTADPAIPRAIIQQHGGTVYELTAPAPASEGEKPGAR